MTLEALDFFCGAGGLTRGLLDSGIKVRAGFDLDNSCKASFEHNNPGANFICRDICELSLADLRKAAGVKTFEHMLFAGCAPCQPFSQQRNKGEPQVRDARLLSEFGRLVHDARPAFVLVENVPGIASIPGFSTFRRFLKIIEDDGYCFDYGVLDAKHFGVPQNRRRLVLIASLNGAVSLPIGKFGKSKRKFKTVRNAIAHFPVLKAGESHPEVPNHTAAVITDLNLLRLRHTPPDGGGRRDWPEELRLACHKGAYNGHTDVYGRLAWDLPAPTLTARCHSISNGRYGHPEQDRAISLREAAAIQSFPDGYQFFGSNKHIARQIGNAVPVRLAKEIGQHLLSCGKG